MRAFFSCMAWSPHSSEDPVRSKRRKVGEQEAKGPRSDEIGRLQAGRAGDGRGRRGAPLYKGHNSTLSPRNSSAPPVSVASWLSPLHGQHTHYDTLTYLLSNTHIHKPTVTLTYHPSHTCTQSYAHFHHTNTHVDSHLLTTAVTPGHTLR